MRGILQLYTVLLFAKAVVIRCLSKYIVLQANCRWEIRAIVTNAIILLIFYNLNCNGIFTFSLSRCRHVHKEVHV